MDDIAIVDLDLAKTTRSRVHSSMRTRIGRLQRDAGTAVAGAAPEPARGAAAGSGGG
jgi:hypothetical protein